MASFLVIPLLVLLALSLGSATVLQFLPLRNWPTIEGIFASLVVGVVATGWLGLVLAELGVFSRALFVLLWLLATSILLAFFWRRRNRGEGNNHPVSAGPASLNRRLPALLFVVWLAAAAWLFFRPHEYIQGGADAGVYVSLGAEIAQHGAFALQDETLAQLDPRVQELFLRPLPTNPVAPAYLFPGFYVEDAAAGKVTPQFYPFHPIWQAIAFSFGATVESGVEAELLITGLWMMLASVAVILTARELGGWPAALLTMAALTITALQVWFARYPTTEALTQFLLWSGLWAMLRWQGEAKPPGLWALTAGTALGTIFLVRIDMLVLLPILAAFMLWLWWRGWKRSDWWFAVPLIVLIGHSFFHGVLFSAPYFYEHIGYGLQLLWRNWWLLLLGGTASLALLWFLSAFRERRGAMGHHRDPVVGTMAASFLAYALYGWFIRPVVAEPVLRPDFYSETVLLLTNNENWLRFGWYLSGVGIWLGVAGICLLIWRVNGRSAVLVATGAAFSVIYLWNVRANPHQIYVMRRFVPAVAPFFLLAGAYLLSQLPDLITRYVPGRTDRYRSALLATAAIAILWLGMLAWSARGFISQVDNKGILQQLADINETLPANSVLLFNDPTPVGIGDFWGTPLKYLFGHDAFKIRDEHLLAEAPLAETIHIWQNNGRAVIWIGDPAWLREQGFEFEDRLYTIASNVLESSYEHKPQEILPAEWTLPAALLQARDAGGS
ncbi:MAG: hypothetical protein ACK2UK_09065 [Candidatus Promineifilaceae bacterium]